MDISVTKSRPYEHTHTQASGGLASPSQYRCKHANLNKHREPFVSVCILVVNADQKAHLSVRSMTDL